MTPSPQQAASRLLREHQLIFERAHTGIVILRNRVIQRCNQRFEEILGYAPGELIGLSNRIYYPSDEAWIETGRLAYTTIAATGTYSGEALYHRRDGTPIWCHITGSMIEPDNPDEGYVWLYEDITEKRQATLALNTLLHEHAMIFERVQSGIVFLRDRLIQRCNFRFEEIFGYPKGTLIGQSTRVLFPDDKTWSRTGSEVYAAIQEHGSFTGDVHYCRRDGTPIVCHVVGRMVDHARPDEGHVWLYDDITAQRATEAALAQSYREQQLIFDNALIGISYQRNRTILRCNRRIEEIFGQPPGGLIGRSTRVLFASERDWAEAGRRVYTDATTDSTFDGEMLYCRSDGTPIWVHIIGRPIDDRGQEQTWIWTYEDITARRAAEEALRQSHDHLEQRVAERTAELSLQLHFLHQLIEAIPGPVFYKDARGRYLGCNTAFSSYIGIAAENLIGKTPHDISPRELADKYVAADRQLFANPGSQIYESQVRYASGEVREIMFHKATFTRPDGELGGLVGVMLDITERKRMEEHLRQAATVFESAAEGFTVTAPDGAIIAVNRAFTEITGYAENEVIGRNPRMLQSGRHDRAFYREMWDSITHNGRWQGEIWNSRKNGEIYPEWISITAVHDIQGRLTNYVATFSDITQHKKDEERIQTLAFSDPLTGLPNRRLLLDRVQHALAASSRSKRHGALFLIDLDDFKTLNDTLGHDKGDILLQQVAQRLTSHVRDGDTVARLGGDEFVVMLEDLDGQVLDASNLAEAVGEKVLASLNLPYMLGEYRYRCTSSIGITLFCDRPDSVDDLLKQADIAMYQAKGSGRNALRFFDPEMQTVVANRVAMQSDLQHGIQNQEFVLHYQPQMDRAGRIIGAEALLRWQHSARGMVSPAEFIPLAEETGLILPLGLAVLETACETLRAWAKSPDTRHLTLAVNVSARQFRQPDFVGQVFAALDCNDADPRRLKLELTESMLLDNIEETIAKMSALKSGGVGFSLDDFGTGYSSLAYLKRLPLDQLKIDQSFVRDILTDPNDAAIVRTILALADALGLGVIAEGVETEDQRIFLAGYGCHAYQGYLYSRPLPLPELAAFMKRR